MTKIKICGLSRPCDIEAANAFMPDYVGFVFAPSRRRVTPERARELRAALSAGIIPVGVFVNETIENIAAIVEAGLIDIVQLHGDESEAFITELKAAVNAPVIKAALVRSPGDARAWENSRADYLLLDSGRGTGVSFDWCLIGKLNRPFFLAGGLDINNIGAAVAAVNPFAVDISGGVETDGLKDCHKMEEVIRRVRTRG